MHKNIRLYVSLDEIVTVDSEYAQEHFEELMDRVCREDIAILVRDHNGSVVLAPYWWYHLCFGLDPKQVIKDLVEKSRFVDAVKVLNHHLTKAVLNNILIQALHIERPNDSVLLEVPGYNFCLKQAAEELGLKLTGTIPNFLCHGPELFDKYIYVITTKEWSVT